MDEKLKARLIGAAILVAVAVLLIPELLSGPKATQPAQTEGSDGKRVFTIELDRKQASRADAPPPVAAEKPAMPQLPAPEVTRNGPVTGQGGAVGKPAAVDQPIAQIAPSDETVVALPASRPAKVTPAADTTAVSVAAPAENAAPSVKTTTASDSAASAEPRRAAGSGSGAWSVQVGAFGTSAAAGKLVSKLRSDGFSAYVVPPSRGAKPLYRVRVGPEPTQAAAERLAGRLKSRGLPAAVVEK